MYSGLPDGNHENSSPFYNKFARSINEGGRGINPRPPDSYSNKHFAVTGPG
jgi:hypothetical protein